MKLLCQKFGVPEGKHEARIIRVEEKDTVNGPAVRVLYSIENPGADFHGAVLSSLFSKVLTPQSKLGKLIEAATGRLPEPGETVDFDEIQGLHVRIDVEHPDEDGADEEAFSRVVAVEPSE